MKQSVSERLREYKARSHLRESSEENLDRAVRWFIELHGDIEASAVRYGHIDDFKSWLIKPRRRIIPHANRQGSHYQPSAATANSYLAIFKPFWGWLAKRGYIETDPFDGITLYPVTAPKYKQYSVEEVGRILIVADLRWRSIVCLGLCSMREAEILNLVISDIDFAENMILINPKIDTATTWRWDIKDYEREFIGLDDSIAGLLLRLIDGIDGDKPYVVLKDHYWRRNLKLRDSGELRHRKRTCPWGNFNRDWRSLCRRAKVTPRRFHDLRGTFATERYREGYDLKAIQTLMRHSSIQTTARYIQGIETKKLVKQSGQTFKKYYASLVP